MEQAVLTAYEVATVLVPFFVAYAAVREHARRTGTQASALLPALAFALYLAAVLYVTGAGTLYDLLRILDGRGPVVSSVSLVPFADAAVMGCALNAVLFVPLGFLLPLAFRPRMRAAEALAFGFAFSLAVELSQLLNNRATDVDDLIMNTLGALAGFALFKAGSRLRHGPSAPRRPAFARMPALPGLAEPALYLTVACVGRFLLFNDYGVSELLYGW
ncbi:VanZ family protein [Eggerthella sp. NSJ-70]|uniref:VanZ family protein n=1 Tax=Eggerthella hominis TaxID=2763043 RepID=A0ABR7BNM6_9ACTN|nr:VanZ family protein [Eggerthella hominis]MBC5582940.1 VanZ family protein [Eggerthella hominis]